MAASLFGTGGTINVDVNGTLAAQGFIASAGQTLFTLTAFTYVPGTGSILVFINGQKQHYPTDFIETSSSSFTLAEGCIVGDYVECLGFPQLNLTAITDDSVLIDTGFTLAQYISYRPICVKDGPYFAQGDNSADDILGINRAIAALRPGQDLYFPDGTYLISANTTQIPNGCGVRFSTGALIKRKSGSGNVVFFTASSGNLFDGVNIDGNSYPLVGGMTGTWLSSSFGFGTNNAAHSDNVIIRGGSIINVQFGVFGLGTRNWKISEVNFSTIQNSGVEIGSYTAFGLVCKYNNIFNNTFTTLGDTAVALIEYIAPGEISFNKVHGNIAVDTQYITNGYAFDVEAGTVAGLIHHNSFYDNTVNQITVTGFTQGGLTMGDFSEHSAICNNVVLGNLGTNGDVGVNAPKSSHMLISGNKINNFQGAAINVDGATGAFVEGNHIRDCGGNAVNYPAIKIALNFSSDKITVKGNKLSWSDTYAYAGVGSSGIVAFRSVGKTVSNLTILDNVFENPIDLGVTVAGYAANLIPNVVIAGNTFIGGGALFTREPISATYCSKLTLQDNSVIDSKRGFDISNSSGAQISENKINTVNNLSSYVAVTGLTGSNIEFNQFNAAAITVAALDPAAQITTGANNNSARYNRGVVTENYGLTGAIATGATVNHGLTYTPVSVTVTAGDAGPTNIYVTAIGATTFTVNYGGGGTHIFNWQARF